MRAIPCPVSPEELRRLVHDEKLPDKDIALQLGGTIKRVQSWRRRFGIEALPRWKRNEVTPVEGQLRSLLVGSMLGDGRIVRQKTASYYTESHCGAQRDYLEWKARLWGPWAGPVAEVPDQRGYEQVRMVTPAHGTLNPWRAMFYERPRKGWKRLLPEVVDLVDEFALAIWYMDDGHAGWWPGITFGMDDESREVARSIFDKFGLKPRWQLHKGRTGTFYMEREDTAERFLDLIRPHVPACMASKLGPFGFQGPHHQVRAKLDLETLTLLSAQGVPIKRIARDLGVGASTVSRRLEQWGIDHPRKQGRPTL